MSIKINRRIKLLINRTFLTGRKEAGLVRALRSGARMDYHQSITITAVNTSKPVDKYR